MRIKRLPDGEEIFRHQPKRVLDKLKLEGDKLERDKPIGDPLELLSAKDAAMAKKLRER